MFACFYQFRASKHSHQLRDLTLKIRITNRFKAVLLFLSYYPGNYSFTTPLSSFVPQEMQ